MIAIEQNNKERLRALRQTNPEFYNGTDEEIIGYALCRVFNFEELDLPIAFYRLEADDYMSLQFVERVCERGYDAIINDGQLIAFKKAV